ncbi:MAG: TetR/AcrR family transcriptional regulator [Pseudomonadota bacterium]
MARPQKYKSENLADLALTTFWEGGYFATSMDDLVRATGVNRHSIYKEFGGKRQLFLASFNHYSETIVTPAFSRVEEADANLDAVSDYFEQQITLAEATGLPGPGCFIANSMTEVAPQDPEVQKIVDTHNERLKQGFVGALRNSFSSTESKSDDEIEQLAQIMLVFTNGLWSLSRRVSNGQKLRDAANNFLTLIRRNLS